MASSPVLVSSCRSSFVPNFTRLFENTLAPGGGAASTGELFCDEIDSIAAKLAEVNSPIKDLTEAVGTSFALVAALHMIFLMQGGFAMLCAGSTRAKNTMNVLLTYIAVTASSAMFFFIFGFALSSDAPDDNGFMGGSHFFLDNYRRKEMWMFRWAFAAAAAAIPSGSLAERTQLMTYIIYATLLSAFVYPVVAHWVWSSSGWLSATRVVGGRLFGSGMIDFGGSGAVHVTGGIAGFWGTFIEGPRLGRFGAHLTKINKMQMSLSECMFGAAERVRFDAKGSVTLGIPSELKGHNVVLVVLGTFFVWFGWYGFNPGSATDTTRTADVVGHVSTTTTLSGAAAGITTLFVKKMQKGHWSVQDVCNGLLAGLVTITSGCAVVEHWAAILTGFVAAWVLIGGNMAMERWEIDDPLEATQLHTGCGAWGVLVTGLLAKPGFVKEVYGIHGRYGLLYGGGGKLLAAHLVGLFCIIVWVSVMMGSLFLLLHRFDLLRISKEQETEGLNMTIENGLGYSEGSSRGRASHMKSAKTGKATDTGSISKLEPEQLPSGSAGSNSV